MFKTILRFIGLKVIEIMAVVLAYIILAKIEDYALKAKYGDKFSEYANDVAFMIPFLKLKRNKTENA